MGENHDWRFWWSACDMVDNDWFSWWSVLALATQQQNCQQSERQQCSFLFNTTILIAPAATAAADFPASLRPFLFLLAKENVEVMLAVQSSQPILGCAMFCCGWVFVYLSAFACFLCSCNLEKGCNSSRSKAYALRCLYLAFHLLLDLLFQFDDAFAPLGACKAKLRVGKQRVWRNLAVQVVFGFPWESPCDLRG